MKTIVFSILFFAYILSPKKHGPAHLPPTKDSVAKNKLVSPILVGFIKFGGGFGASGGCGTTNLTTAAYEAAGSNRCLGQIAIGDILTDAGGTPINGGGQGYGFVMTSGQNAHLGIKLNLDGSIGDIANCNDASIPPHFPTVGFYYMGGVNCAQTTFTLTNVIYIDPDDPAPRNNRVCYINTGGSVLGNGTWTIASSIKPNVALATFTTAGGNGRITSLSYCTTNPQVYAGADATYALPSPSVTLSAAGSFSPSNCISSWSWSEVSGPNSATITSPTLITTTVTGVIAGTYIFRATATDQSLNSGTDDVQVTVVSAPACTGSTKLPIKYWMVFGPCSNFGQGNGSAATLDTFPYRTPGNFPSKAGNRTGQPYSLFDTDCDPWNGQYDANLNLPGFQRDSTLIKGLVEFTGLHNYYHLGNGHQIVVVVDLGRPYNVERWAWYDSTLAAHASCVQVFVCNLDTASRAVFEFETGIPCVPTFTIGTSVTPGFYTLDNRRDKGQYLVFRFDSVGTAGMGPVISSIWPYGCVANGVGDTADTRISPQWSPNKSRDTTYPVGSNHSGIAVATGVPGGSYWDDTLKNHRGQGGYLGVFGPTSGLIDTFQHSPWRGITSLINSDIKYNLGEYGDPNLFFDSAYYYSGGVKIRYKYIVDKSAPARIYFQTGFRIPEIIPTDSVGADRRLSTSYGRNIAQEIWLAAKIMEGGSINFSSQYGQYIQGSDYYGTNIASSTFLTGRARFLVDFNENNAGYSAAADSNWMPPAAIRALFDTLYRAWHDTFNGIPLTGQGYAAWGENDMKEAEFLQRLKYKSRAYRLWDYRNMHTTVSTFVHHVEKSYAGNVGSHSVFAGQRNEYWKILSTIDTLNWYAGENIPMVIFEYSVGSPRHYETPTDPLGSDAGLTALGAAQIGSLPSEESQAYILLSQQVDYEMTPGLMYTFAYELFDAADTSSPFQANTDNNNGRANHILNPPWYKPAYFVGRQHVKWLANYAGRYYLNDKYSDTRAALFQNVSSRDSFCLFVQFNGYTDPTALQTFTLQSDVTTVTCLQHKNNDFTDAGNTVVLTVTGGKVSFVPSYKGHYIFFKSPILAARIKLGYIVHRKVQMF